MAHIIGTAGNDTLTGTTDADLIEGLAGNDTLDGGAGEDTLIGGAGDDLLIGGPGNDTLVGGTAPGSPSGTDTASYRSSPAGIVVTATTVADGFGTTDSVSDMAFFLGSDFADRFTSVNIFFGATVEGYAGNDSFEGVPSITYAHSPTGVVVNLATGQASDGWGGTDTITYPSTIYSSFTLHVTGSALNDTLTAGFVAATLDGGDGNDTLQGGAGLGYKNGPAGADTLNGGAGDDTLIAGTGVAALNGGDGNDTLIGGAAYSTFDGGAGDDVIRVGAGGGRVLGGPGNDLITGGGITTLDYSTATAGVRVDGPRGLVTKPDGVDKFSGVQVFNGSTYADVIIGDDQPHTFDGGGGKDILTGGLGDDLFYVRPTSTVGTVTIAGGGGVDTINLQTLYPVALQNFVVDWDSGTLILGNTIGARFSGISKLTGNYLGGNITGPSMAGPMPVYLGVNAPIPFNGESRTVIDGQSVLSTFADFGLDSFHPLNVDLAFGTAIEQVYRSRFPENFSAATLVNVLSVVGTGVDDVMSGDYRANIFVPGRGNNTLDGRGGNDTASYADAVGPVVADLTTGVITHDGFRDTVASIENVVGGAGSNTLYGSTGDNLLTGGSGNDTFIGRGGADVLSGGAGDDTFVFTTAAQLAAAALVDGGTGTDTLVLQIGSGLTDAAFAHATNLEVLSFTGGGATLSVTLGAAAAAAFTGHAVNLVAPVATALTVDGTALGAGTTLTVTSTAGASFTVTAPSAHLVGGAGSNTYHLGAGSYVITGAGVGDVVDHSAAGRRDAAVAANADGGATVTLAGETDVLSHVGAVSFVDGTLSFDPHGVAAQVLRLYQAGLGRAPDEAGAHYWTNAIEHGLALHDLAASCLTSPEFTARYGSNLTDGAFVDQLYQNVLHRDGDAAGRAVSIGALASGTSRADLLTLFSEGPENLAGTAALVSGGVWDLSENAAQAARLYDTVFGRLPDRGGLAFWRGFLDGGGKLLDMANAAVGSPEFGAKYGALGNRDFATAEYANTLHRAGDQAGVDFWTAQLDAGVTRAQVVVLFSEGAEHQALTAPTIINADHAKEGIMFA